jgi:RNA polymerase sigma factor (sigma-70 family)
MTVSQMAFEGSSARASVASADVDRAAVTELEAARGRELRGYARHLGLTEDEAADAVQEVLLRLWVTLDSGVSVVQPEAWAFKSLYRLCMDAHRWRRRARGLTDRLGLGLGVSTRTDATDRIAVWTAAERLPERQRLALYLRYRADLPFDEIGEILGVAAVSARSHVSRALATLRVAFHEEDDR